jgi:hypothetical protein
MVCVEEKGLLLEEFSGRVRRHFPERVWRSLFEDRSGSAEFGSAQRTLVCVECPATGPFQRDAVVASLRRLAKRHDGLVDPCAEDFAFVSFPDPEAALRTAVELQRLVPRARLRMGLVSGRCRMALVSAGGQDFLMLLGSERARVEALTARAAPGTIQLATEAYERLQATISQDLGSCLVLQEFDHDVLTEVSLTLPPDAAADVSTFAGLGLTQ